MNNLERAVFIVYLVNLFLYGIGDDYFYRMSIVSVLTVGVFLLSRKDMGVFYDLVLFVSLIFIVPYFLFEIPIATRVVENQLAYSQLTFLALLLLIFGLHVWRFVKIPVNHGYLNHNSYVSIKCDLITYICILLILFFSYLMIGSGTIIDSTYREVTAERYTFIEYASVLTLLGAIFSKSKKSFWILILAASIYLMVCMLSGLRLRMISTGIVVFCLLGGMDVTWRKKLLISVGFAALFILGLVRNYGISNIESNADLASSVMAGGVVISTYGGVFQTSNFYLYFIEHFHGADILVRMQFFVGDVASIFVSKGILPLDFNLKGALYSSIDVPGGGLFSSFMLVYFGIFGVFITSLILGKLMITLMWSKKSILQPVKILVAAYAFRTILYDWTVVFKVLLYLGIGLFVGGLVVYILRFIAQGSYQLTHSKMKPDSTTLKDTSV